MTMKGYHGKPRSNQVWVDEQNQPLANTSVAMLKADGHTRIEQRVTNGAGQIELYGAETGDRVDALCQS